VRGKQSRRKRRTVSRGNQRVRGRKKKSQGPEPRDKEDSEGFLQRSARGERGEMAVQKSASGLLVKRKGTSQGGTVSHPQVTKEATFEGKP